MLRLLNLIDPSGVASRCRHRVKRRVYDVPGPNHVWHADNHDKLKRFGFPIYGCIDGFSRKVVCLHVMKTNNKPTLIRVDDGTDANIVKITPVAWRWKHGDEYAGENSFLRGRSTHNQRVESYWPQSRLHMDKFYTKLFRTIEE